MRSKNSAISTITKAERNFTAPHSSLSDGLLPSGEVIEVHKTGGYDFLVLWEHFVTLRYGRQTRRDCQPHKTFFERSLTLEHQASPKSNITKNCDGSKRFIK